jgi:hypothetical protein
VKIFQKKGWNRFGKEEKGSIFAAAKQGSSDAGSKATVL